MYQDSNTDPALAFELQARYAPGEAWITLDVFSARVVAAEEGLFRGDVWGRAPDEVRVVAFHGADRRAA